MAPALRSTNKDSTVQEIVAHFGVKALAITFSRGDPEDVENLGPSMCQPIAQPFCDKLWPIVKANIIQDAALNHGFSQHAKYLVAVDPARH